MDKKKVLFMLTSMNIGGVEKSLLSLLSEISRVEYDVTILLLEKKGGFLPYIPDWVKVEEAPWFKKIKPIIMQAPQKTIRNYINQKEYLKVLFFLVAYFLSKYFNYRNVFYKNAAREIPIDKNEYDIAIAYQGPTDIIDYYIANKVKAKEKVSWVHFDVTKHKVNKNLYKRIFKKFSKINVVSEVARNSLLEVFPFLHHKTRVVMNVIPYALIKQMSTYPIEFDENFKGIRIVTVGRLSYEKGQDLAIKTLAKLKKEGYKVRWYCIGDGNARKQYEEMIESYDLKNDFLLLGSTSNPYPYIKKSDIYVQTSRHEGYCLTLAEAKCLHKPIVSTNFIGAYEQIKHGNNGLIVECNEDDLYRELKNLINCPEQRDQLIENLRQPNLIEENVISI